MSHAEEALKTVSTGVLLVLYLIYGWIYTVTINLNTTLNFFSTFMSDGPKIRYISSAQV